jgi:hypothetical protein
VASTAPRVARTASAIMEVLRDVLDLRGRTLNGHWCMLLYSHIRLGRRLRA